MVSALQPLRPQPSRLGALLRRRAVWGGLLAIALGVKLAMCYRGELDCAEAARAGDDGVTVAVCNAEYARTKDPRTGSQLANALRRKGEPAAAGAIARSLLATSAQADALYVLGKIAADEERHDDAEAALAQAAELHRRQERWNELAKDLLASGNVATARKRFAEALPLLDECAAQARRAGERTTEGYCHLGSARALSKLGHRGGALQEIDRAAALFTGRWDQAWIYLAKGDELQEGEEHAQAVVAYEQALALAERAQLRAPELSARLNLAYSLAATGRFDQAEEHLARAIAQNERIATGSDRWMIRALIDRGRGQLAPAAEAAERATDAAELEAAELKPRASDDLIAAETLRAELAMRLGQLAVAESWARRAIAHVDALRAAQPLLQLRAWVLKRHRAPHEILFAAVARAGKAEAALTAFDAWMARSTLDALTLSGEALTLGEDRKRVAAKTEEMKRLLPALQTGHLGRAGAGRDTAELTDASLLALVVADGEIWRLESEAGVTQVARVAAFDELAPQLDELRTYPADRPLASALGDKLLPAALAQPTARVLHVVLDEPLAYLPVAALRRGGRTLGSLRPLVRAIRPANLTCWRPRSYGAPDSSPAGASATTAPLRLAVVADSLGDLPGARREAEEIAGHLGASSPSIAVGAAATRAALYRTAGADLLHLALHAEVGELGGELVLADGKLSALELAGTGSAARQVVLATCSSAVSRPGTYSLAMAFLAAGAEQVVGTLRPIVDEDAARITAQLYRADPSDLVSALWRLQAEAPHDAADLLHFAVFGNVPCSPR
jgi:tetratricopeptide (TPR) repeat protein